MEPEKKVTHIHGDKRSEPLSDLASDLPREISELVRKEIALGKSEMQDKMRVAQRGAVTIGSGGALLFYGGIALVVCVIALLALAMPVWASALIVTAVLMIAGAALVARGRQEVRDGKLAPEKTADALKEDRHLLQRRKESKYGGQ